MIISISGAQSVGKTTLLEAIEKVSLSYTYKKEITRELAERGFEINEAGNDDTQKAIIESHMIRLKDAESKPSTITVLDRNLLDGLVYTQYLHEIGQVSYDTFKNAESVFEKNINRCDLMFYIRPEFDIVDDGQRSTDLTFRNRIVELFEEKIAKYDLPITLLTGSIEERVEDFVDMVAMVIDRKNSIDNNQPSI